jgi:hypothetical protein
MSLAADARKFLAGDSSSYARGRSLDRTYDEGVGGNFSQKRNCSVLVAVARKWRRKLGNAC